MLKKYYSTKIGKFVSEHFDWENILTQKPYCLKISKDNDYILFKYNQTDSDFSNDIVKEARGLIFRDDQWEYPVCHAFDKFFNVEETNAEILDWSTAHVTQKIDGSLIKVWFDDT